MSEEKEKVVEENVDGEVEIPSYKSVEWHDYVMSRFDNSELVDIVNGPKTFKAPTIPGLRRVVTLVLGDIEESQPVDYYYNNGNHTVRYIVRILTPSGYLEYGAIAGANKENTDDGYDLYLDAIAETRAEARALRKVLGLRTVAADEISRKGHKVESMPEETDGEWNGADPITSTQITTIEVKCKTLGICIEKFVQSEFNVKNIENLTKEDGIKLITKINKYQSTKSSLEIPEEIRI